MQRNVNVLSVAFGFISIIFGVGAVVVSNLYLMAISLASISFVMYRLGSDASEGRWIDFNNLIIGKEIMVEELIDTEGGFAFCRDAKDWEAAPRVVSGLPNELRSEGVTFIIQAPNIYKIVAI